MGINKVVVNDEVKLDLTADTVSPSTLALGITAHDKSGELITGTMESGSDDLLFSGDLQYYDYNFLLIKKEIQFIKTNNLTHSITICFWKYRNPIKLYYSNKAHYIEAKRQLIKVFQ